MIILLAESKTFNTASQLRDAESLTTPVFNSQAKEIIDSLSRMSAASLRQALGLSPTLAARMQGYINEFNAGESIPVRTAFTGVAFKALDIPSLDEAACGRLRSQLRIISSLYGYLRPNDSIRPYRMEYKSVPPFPGIPLSTYWRELLANPIREDMAKDGNGIILNLLPADAQACLPLKELREDYTLVTPSFKEMRPDGTLSTPIAGKLKRMRGLFARMAITEDMKSLHDLLDCRSMDFAYYPEGSEERLSPVFIC